MKHLIIILVLLFSTNIKAQIINIDGANQNYGQHGYYYKDINNVLDDFVGTYVYSNGTTAFTIILEKKVHSSVADNYYEDMIIGSYKYVENGVEKINVLNDLNNNFPDGTYYKITGNSILTGNEMGCFDCDPNEKHLYCSIKDPVSNSIDDLFIRKTIVGGQEAIKIFILHRITYRLYGSPVPLMPAYPLSQDIILLKQ